MNKKTMLIAGLAVISLMQLSVPATMILDRENVLTHGAEYKFRTAPIDPNDPFRGKYITLSFSDNRTKVSPTEEWNSGEPIYVILQKDESGFAQIQSATKTEPTADKDYVKVEVSYQDSNLLIIDYPFDRYYMEEFKAPEAEILYRQSEADSTQIAYALVRVKEGRAVLKDVLINGKSIEEIVKTR